MSLIVYLIVLFVSGLFVGGLARLALPGPDPMTLTQTALVGIAGSLIAGAIVWFATDGRYEAGIPLSILGATLIVYGIRRSRGGTLTDPGPGLRRRRRR